MIVLIDPGGNFTQYSEDTPSLQIGELKYGRPILDGLARPERALEDAARVALLSVDATVRSDLSIAPPSTWPSTTPTAFGRNPPTDQPKTTRPG